MSQQRSMLLPIALATLISAIIFSSFGYFLGKTSGEQRVGTNSNNDSSSPVSKFSPSPESSVDANGMKAYNNTKHQITFKYPVNWDVYEDPREPLDPTDENASASVVDLSNQKSGVYLGEGEAGIHIYRHPSADVTKLTDWFNKYQKNTKGVDPVDGFTVTDEVTITDTTFLGVPAILQRSVTSKQSEGKPSIFKAIYFVMDGEVWSISFSTPTPDEAKLEIVFDQLVQSFTRSKRSL